MLALSLLFTLLSYHFVESNNCAVDLDLFKNEEPYADITCNPNDFRDYGYDFVKPNTVCIFNCKENPHR